MADKTLVYANLNEIEVGKKHNIIGIILERSEWGISRTQENYVSLRVCTLEYSPVSNKKSATLNFFHKEVEPRPAFEDYDVLALQEVSTNFYCNDLQLRFSLHKGTAVFFERHSLTGFLRSAQKQRFLRKWFVKAAFLKGFVSNSCPFRPTLFSNSAKEDLFRVVHLSGVYEGEQMSAGKRQLVLRTPHVCPLRFVFAQERKKRAVYVQLTEAFPSVDQFCVSEDYLELRNLFVLPDENFPEFQNVVFGEDSSYLVKSAGCRNKPLLNFCKKCTKKVTSKEKTVSELSGGFVSLNNALLALENSHVFYFVNVRCRALQIYPNVFSECVLKNCFYCGSGDRVVEKKNGFCCVRCGTDKVLFCFRCLLFVGDSTNVLPLVYSGDQDPNFKLVNRNYTKFLKITKTTTERFSDYIENEHTLDLRVQLKGSQSRIYIFEIKTVKQS